MFKLIFKNLWSRRKRNCWLLIELIVVTVLAWIILDPVIVKTYVSWRSPGYDIERLARVSLMELSERSPRYDADAASPEKKTEDVQRIIERAAAHPYVDKVAPLLWWTAFETSGSAWQTVNVNDSVGLNVSMINFVSGTPFFEAYGLKSMPGSPTAQQLTDMKLSGGDIIISESLARALFPDGRAVGRYLYENTPGFKGPSPDGSDSRVAGVVNDAVTRCSYGRNMIMYRPQPMSTFTNGSIGDVQLLVRVKPGVSMGAFLNDFRPYMDAELKSGNIQAYSVKDYMSIRDELELSLGLTNELRLKIALAVFFLVNLCLGVTGTFYLQTRKRSEDAGIMRSFGATPGYIMRELLGEGWVITTVAWLAGCIGYMQYALKEGLEITGGRMSTSLVQFMPDWTDNFMLHFTIVSLIIYVVLMAVVSAGIYLPARRIARVNPVDALRDE